jgi:TPR repeat protein
MPLLAAPSLARADSEVSQCDRLAAHPFDPNRPAGVSGVLIQDLEAAGAIAACERALAQSPGQARLQFQLARGLYKAERYPEALRFIRLAAAQGYTPAERNLGHGYYRGKILPADDGEAVKWFRKAAEKGHALAQYDLGKMYERGHGVALNFAEAAKWYRRAAEQKLTLGQYSLAYLYQSGSGVPKDRVQALMWFSIAAALGDTYSDGVRELAAFSLSADKVAEADRRARAWLDEHGK